ncbi:MAG TPA: HAMP domain-containing protein, partial [Cyclobacteriaceae bacterium]
MLPEKKQLFHKLLPSIAVGLLIQFALAGLLCIDHEQIVTINLTVIGIILFCVAVLWLVLSVRSILKISSALQTIHQATDVLSTGGYPAKFKIEGNDELSKVSENLNVLAGHLKAKSDFINHISNGNLEVDYALSGNDDVMGKALAGIKSNLVRMKTE